MSSEQMNPDRIARWRLILGQPAQLGLCEPSLDPSQRACDRALSWLYDREGDSEERGMRPSSLGDGDGAEAEACAGSGGDQGSSREGGREASRLTVPEWVNSVHRLFPRESIERLERDAVERYRIEQVVTNAEVLRRVQPSMGLLKAVLRMRHLMNPAVLALARDLVARVVADLIEKLAREVVRTFSGVRQSARSTTLRVSRDLDARRTIRENLRHWSVAEQRLYVHTPYFFPRGRKNRLTWQVVLLVDQSGSMLGSVIHSAVMASCLWSLPSIKTHLCVFDTRVVDLTGQITDPVETLMKVQLGGGTDIGQAVAYGASLIDTPRRAMLVIVSDFFEGADSGRLVSQVRSLCGQGTHVLGLAALDPEAAPVYDRDLAARLVDAGAHVGAMTPIELAAWIAERVHA